MITKLAGTTLAHGSRGTSARHIICRESCVQHLMHSDLAARSIWHLTHGIAAQKKPSDSHADILDIVSMKAYTSNCEIFVL